MRSRSQRAWIVLYVHISRLEGGGFPYLTEPLHMATGRDVSVCVWLASLHTLRIDKHRTDASVEAHAPSLQRLLPAPANERPDPSQPCVFALAEIRCDRRYNHMTVLSDGEREQVRFWSEMVNRPLHDDLFFFEVLSVAALPEPQQLASYGSRQFRGLVSVLEFGQPPRLTERLTSRPAWMPPGDVEVVVRLPALFARLVSAGVWGTFCLPQLPVRGSRTLGTASLSFSWDLLNYSIDQLPRPPMSFIDHEIQVSEVTLRHEDLASIANHLRSFATTVDIMTLEGQDVYASVEHGVALMDALVAQMSTLAFVKTIRDMRGKASLSTRSGGSTPYRVAFLVQALVFADLIRSKSLMQEALARAVKMVLPRVLWPLFEHMLKQCGHVVPNASTISRWRVLVDGAYMMVYRKWNQQHCAEGSGRVIYMMADSSVQHHRDFEHIIVKTAPREKLPRLLEDSWDLCELWCLYHA